MTGQGELNCRLAAFPSPAIIITAVGNSYKQTPQNDEVGECWRDGGKCYRNSSAACSFSYVKAE